MMDDLNIRDLADCTCARLQRATRRMAQIYDHALAPAGLTINQFGLLARLYGTQAARGGGMSIKALAEVLGMDSSTLTRNLRPLELRGLISDHADPEDGRARLVSITAAGAGKLAEAVPCWRSAQAQVAQRLGAGAAGELDGLLEQAFASLSPQR